MKCPLNSNDINLLLFNKGIQSSRNHKIINHNTRNTYKSLKYLSIDNKLLKLLLKKVLRNLVTTTLTFL